MREDPRARARLRAEARSGAHMLMQACATMRVRTCACVCEWLCVNAQVRALLRSRLFFSPVQRERICTCRRACVVA
eukprot:6199629-Pleurochrysis_carterae.AAC.2